MSARCFRSTLVAITFATFSLSFLSAALDPQAFLGQWAFDREHSTDLSPWRNCRLVITQSGHQLTITRNLDGGRRKHTDVIPLDITKTTNEVPQTWWIDNRHLGAYSPRDATKTVQAKTLDDGKLLRLETDLVLETQQGPRDVNIISQYQISPDGQVLTVTDLRSTRPRPVIHVFTRITE